MTRKRFAISSIVCLLCLLWRFGLCPFVTGVSQACPVCLVWEVVDWCSEAVDADLSGRW